MEEKPNQGKNKKPEPKDQKSSIKLEFKFDQHSLEDSAEIDCEEIEVNGKTLLLPNNDIVDGKKNKS